MKLFTIFKDIVKNTFSKPYTRKYPFEVRPAFEGERGKLIIEDEKCIFCGICARKCPSNALKVTKKPDQSWQFERYRCILCAACVEACPKKCLHMVSRLDDRKQQ